MEIDRAASAHLLLFLLSCTYVKSNAVVDCCKTKHVRDLVDELHMKARDLLTLFLSLQGPPFSSNTNQLCRVSMLCLPKNLLHPELEEALLEIHAAIDFFDRQLGNVREQQQKLNARSKLLTDKLTANMNMLTSLRTHFPPAPTVLDGPEGSSPEVDCEPWIHGYSRKKFQEKRRECAILQAFENYVKGVSIHFQHSYSRHCHGK